MNTFEDRLQQFIQMENLTPAKLADSLGVQRGGLSHLLAGRNKPSFDFITKLLELYPDLNCDWLLLGKGKPFKSSSADTPSLFATPSSAMPSSETQFSAKPSEAILHSTSQATIFDQASEILIEESEPEVTTEPGISTETEISTGSKLSSDTPLNCDNPSLSAENKRVTYQKAISQPLENRIFAERTIARITIFYSDGTFEER